MIAERAFGVFIDVGIIFPVLVDLADISLRVGDTAFGVIARFDDQFMEVELTDAPEHVATSSGPAMIVDGFRGHPPAWGPRVS